MVSNVMLKLKLLRRPLMSVVSLLLRWTVILRVEEPSQLLPPLKVLSFLSVMVSMLIIWNNSILNLLSEDFLVKVILNN